VSSAVTCGRRPIVTMVTSVAGVGAVTSVSLYGEYVSGVHGASFALEVAVGALACGLVLVLFRRPVTGALLLAGLAVIPAATPASTVGTLQVASRRPLSVAVGVATAGIAAHLLRWLWLPMPGLSFGWWFTLVVVGHGGLVGWGALIAARGALIASLRERARRAEAEQGRRVAEARAAERALIAREMHDVLAHRLSLLATYAGALEYRPDASAERLSHAAGVIRASAHQALEELREVITLLREDSTDEPGRPLPALADLPGLVAESRSVGTPVELRDTLTEPDAVPGATGRTAYRVVQEALTNARKHAPGQPISIALGGAPGSRLSIEVSNPVGAPSRIPGAGTGLVGLTERVRLAGGELDHETSSGEFRLRAWLPWPV
jgi:signal transduction histidine kinase